MVKVLSDKMIEWAKKKYKEGYFYYEIGDALFVSGNTVMNAIKGVERNSLPELIYCNEDRNEFIKEKIAKGYQQKQIAEVMGLSVNIISLIVRKYGYKKKPRAKLVYDFSQE